MKNSVEKDQISKIKDTSEIKKLVKANLRNYLLFWFILHDVEEECLQYYF